MLNLHFICKIFIWNPSENFKNKIFYRRKIYKKRVLRLKFNAEHIKSGLIVV